MASKTIAAAPQTYARIAGAFYLAIIMLGFFAEGFITHKLIVPGDIVASAHHIFESSILWKLGNAANLMVALCAVPLLWIEYQLLRPVNTNLVLLAVFFNLVSLAIESVSKLFLLLVIPILGDTDYLTLSEPSQSQLLASLALKSHDIAFNIALIFFGCTCLVNGYLIFKSEYFPKFLGVLMQLAGASYLIACFSTLFIPAFANSIMPAILIPALIGEASFCLWLLIKGIDVKKWRERLSMDPKFN